MSETNTFDASEPQEVVDARAADEADSLRIGEELAQQQEQLLAGKYRDAQELEKAYLELQGKLGSQEEAAPEQPQEPEAPAPQDVLATYLEQKNSGEVSKEVQDAFDELSKEELLEMMQQPQQQQQESDDISDADVTAIYNAVGGEEQYGQLIEWAASNLAPEAIAAYDQAIDSGNMAAINLALRGLAAAYSDANGQEGATLQGRGTPPSQGGYRSQAELLAAMNDPRYDNDPAYRMDVFAKLEQSPELQF